jgi:uncharacterized protein (TIGR03000 family)
VLLPCLCDAAPCGCGPALADLNPGQAAIVVELPADATLSIDGKRSMLAGAKRTIVTPPLEENKTYTYTVRVQATQHGRKVEKVERVSFRAGQTVNVKFEKASKAGQEEEETASTLSLD